MAIQLQSQHILSEGFKKNSEVRWSLSTFPLMFILVTLLIPIFAQISSPLEQNQVFGRNIVNSPNHNSSSGVRNMPFVEISRDKLVRIGHVCELDSDCGNYSLCMLKKRVDDIAIKICECDPKEMRRINQTCYILPGHQCYFPNMNSHGYRFVECLPGSKCRKSVNRSMPDNGYCMCDSKEKEGEVTPARDWNMDFEMARCAGSSFEKILGRCMPILIILTQLL